MKKLLITVAIAMVVCVGAQASVVYTADFESPAYSIGALDTQQGWIGAAPAKVVADGTTPDGAQALYVAGPTEGGHNYTPYSFSATADLVKVSWYMNGPTGAAGHAAMHLRSSNTYFNMNEFTEAGEAGWGYYNLAGGTGNQYAGDAGAKLVWNAGTWEKLEFWVDIANDQFAVEINDVLIDEWYDNGGALIGTHTWTPFMANVSNFNRLQVGIGTMNATGTPYMVDGILVEEGLQIPEPGSMVLLGLGLLIARKKRS